MQERLAFESENA